MSKNAPQHRCLMQNWVLICKLFFFIVFVNKNTRTWFFTVSVSTGADILIEIFFQTFNFFKILFIFKLWIRVTDVAITKTNIHRWRQENTIIYISEYFAGVCAFDVRFRRPYSKSQPKERERENTSWLVGINVNFCANLSLNEEFTFFTPSRTAAKLENCFPKNIYPQRGNEERSRAEMSIQRHRSGVRDIFRGRPMRRCVSRGRYTADSGWDLYRASLSSRGKRSFVTDKKKADRFAILLVLSACRCLISA